MGCFDQYRRPLAELLAGVSVQDAAGDELGPEAGFARRLELRGWCTPLAGELFARQQVDLYLNHLAMACSQMCRLVAPRHAVRKGGIAQQPWLARELSGWIPLRLPAFLQFGPQVASARWGRLCVSLWGCALRSSVQAKGAVPSASTGGSGAAGMQY